MMKQSWRLELNDGEIDGVKRDREIRSERDIMEEKEREKEREKEGSG